MRFTSKRKRLVIKNDMPGNNDFSKRSEALKAFMKRTITNECTSLNLEIHLVFVVRLEKGETRAPKDL